MNFEKKWEESSSIVVRILQIEAAVVNIEGIIDVTGTTINGVEQNLQITNDTVPVRGEITCT